MHTLVAATGAHTAEDPPKASSLKSLTQLQLWVEGVAGEFHLRVKSVKAGKRSEVRTSGGLMEEA